MELGISHGIDNRILFYMFSEVQHFYPIPVYYPLWQSILRPE
jgi:hypothetical protein